MTANDIGILMFYAVFPNEHPLVPLSWVENSLNNLIRQRLLTMDTKELTDKGKCYVNMLKETPLPEKSWHDPRKEN